MRTVGSYVTASIYSCHELQPRVSISRHFKHNTASELHSITATRTDVTTLFQQQSPEVSYTIISEAVNSIGGDKMLMWHPGRAALYQRSQLHQ
mmetsp:Transcript_25590/g.43137  ORF Transcript_25590/g.43137 Transcript_25590/m.43137 type:complete len:93 (+) Transcript_25590:210-488(+)